MPTYIVLPSFLRDWERLTPQQKRAFRVVLRRFVEDLRRGQLRPGLRAHTLYSHPDIWEMTWAPDGRATFEYGRSIRPGDPHIIWRRIGTHAILDAP